MPSVRSLAVNEVESGWQAKVKITSKRRPTGTWHSICTEQPDPLSCWQAICDVDWNAKQLDLEVQM